MELSSSNLANLQRYLKRFAQNDQPAAFEYLVANAFSQILYLPFQSRDSEDDTVRYRVLWHGNFSNRTKTISKSPSGPDSVCFAYGFYILLESTLRSGTGQWRKEFIESLKHYDAFVKERQVDKGDIYLVLVVQKLHKDTYTGFKQKVKEGYNIVILESASLAKIGDITKLIFTVRHLDIRLLFNNLLKNTRESSSFDKFRIELNRSISEWGKSVLKQEKTVFFGLRSYEAMQEIGRNIIGTSEILLKLQQNNKVRQYEKILGEGDLAVLIRDGLLHEKLACLITTPNEDLFCRVNCEDFGARGQRLIKAVEEING